jgi:hypothetical protein
MFVERNGVMEYGYFPELYPDELLYSVCARYQSNIGCNAQKSYIEKLFDIRSCCAITDFPSHLSGLATKMTASTNTVDSIIINHTNYPYYKPFLPHETARKVWSFMISNDHGSKIHMTLGTSASSVPRPRHLRYCNECIVNDLDNYGVTYWRRVHQLSGVCVCPVHASILNISDILISTQRGKHLFADLNKVFKSGDVKQTEDFETEKLLHIAKQSLELLNSPYENKLCKDAIREFYLVNLDRKGYLTVGGRIRFKLLIHDFNNFHGQTLLKSLNSSVESYDEDTWLHKVFRMSPGNCHPLRHLLLFSFFESSINDVMLTNQMKPFGVSPWPCLNKAAVHYRESVVSECIVTTGSKTRKPTGHFNCECGFSYIRTGPDTSQEDRYRIGRIQTFGPIWLKTARELSSISNLSQREKARRLGVDSKTFIKMLSTEVKEGDKAKVLTKRRIARKPQVRHNTSIVERVNWQERDRVLSQQVQLAAANILAEEKPKRITKNELIRRGELHSSVVYYPTRLPETCSTMAELIEDLDDFQIRRIDWAIEQLTKHNAPKEWKVRRLAAITPKCTKKVQRYLNRRLG